MRFSSPLFAQIPTWLLGIMSQICRRIQAASVSSTDKTKSTHTHAHTQKPDIRALTHSEEDTFFLKEGEDAAS